MKYFIKTAPYGFGDDQYCSMPKDGVLISDEEYSALFEGQKAGKRIDFSSGWPRLVSYKPSVDEVSRWARELRNSIRDQLDKLLNPASTIKGVLVTSEQKTKIIEYSVILANWPETPNWPMVPFPAVPSFLNGLILPVWDYQDYTKSN